MKSKKAQFVLLLCTIIVWGLIFYRVFIYLNKDKIVNVTKNIKRQQSENKISSDSLTLLLNYTDPFHLSRSLSTNHFLGKSINTNKEKKENQKAEPLISIPKIIYKGLIYNQLKHKYVSVISSNQSSYLLSEGDSIQSWIVEKIYKDSLQLSSLKQKACIKLLK